MGEDRLREYGQGGSHAGAGDAHDRRQSAGAEVECGKSRPLRPSQAIKTAPPRFLIRTIPLRTRPGFLVDLLHHELLQIEQVLRNELVPRPFAVRGKLHADEIADL